VPIFPALSYAFTIIVNTPAVRGTLHEQEYGLFVSVQISVLFTKNSTFVTATLSTAFTDIAVFTPFFTTALLRGEVIVTTGVVTSGIGVGVNIFVGVGVGPEDSATVTVYMYSIYV
jgi:hypothetical protein